MLGAIGRDRNAPFLRFDAQFISSLHHMTFIATSCSSPQSNMSTRFVSRTCHPKICLQIHQVASYSRDPPSRNLNNDVFVRLLSRRRRQPWALPPRANIPLYLHQYHQSTMKLAVASLLAGSALAFAPAQQGARVATTLNAEKSKSLPFMNRPALVSSKVL